MFIGLYGCNVQMFEEDKFTTIRAIKPSHTKKIKTFDSSGAEHHELNVPASLWLPQSPAVQSSSMGVNDSKDGPPASNAANAENLPAPNAIVPDQDNIAGIPESKSDLESDRTELDAEVE